MNGSGVSSPFLSLLAPILEIYPFTLKETVPVRKASFCLQLEFHIVHAVSFLFFPFLTLATSGRERL